MASEHKHAGSRRNERKPPTQRLQELVLAVAMTAALVAWGYLVLLAIDFGTTARGGDDRAWWYLGLSSLGAVLCLFLGLVLVARLIRTLGITPPTEKPTGPPEPSRTPGGRRAAR